MPETSSKARLVEPGALEPGSGITTTLPRKEIEDALRADEPPELFLDVARGRNGGAADVEAHTIRVEWDRRDLEELLRTTTDEDVALTFDRSELEQALEEADVEGHGLREKAVVLTVAASAAAAIAGHASARPMTDAGGSVATPAPIEQVSDAATAGQTDQFAGYGQTRAVTPAASDPTQLVSDAGSGGQKDPFAGYGQTRAVTPASSSELVGDAAQGGGYGASAEATPLVSDSATGAGYGTGPEATPLISDSASTGSQHASAEATPLISDTASSAQAQPTEAASGGGGIDISAPSPAQTGGIVGGVALLITGAGFALRGRRGAAARPT
jgi:hypothetical protein